MTGDTTPQDRADDLISAFLAGQFGDTLWPAHLGRLATQLASKLADAGLLCSPPVVQPQQDEDGSLRSVPPTAGEAVSYDELVDWVTRLEVTVKPVNGVINIMAESMADAFADFLRANGIEVSRG